MKKHPVLTLPDGRKVIVDAEMEIKKGFVYDEVEKNIYEVSNPNEITYYNLIREGSQQGHLRSFVIFTLGFSLPNVEEIEIISEAEVIAKIILPEHFDGCTYLDGKPMDLNEENRKHWISGYKAANKNFTEEQVETAISLAREGRFENDAFMFNNYPENIIQSLTRPDISEIFIEYEVDEKETVMIEGKFDWKFKIKSITAKDSSGKEIKIRVKK